jgi:hypothetical protein
MIDAFLAEFGRIFKDGSQCWTLDIEDVDQWLAAAGF